jgi:hypothetical protein
MWRFRHQTRHVFRRSSVARRASILTLLIGAWIAVALSSVETSVQTTPSQAQPGPAPTAASQTRTTLDKYCVTCHNGKLRTGGLALDTLDASNPGANPEIWEKVVGKLRQASMPPPGRPRPDAATYDGLASSLELQLDRAWEANPNPGKVSPVHRLNRTEYNNAIRDLFAIDIDVTSLLPADETADGSFDNFGDVLSISTAHLDRYMSVARQVTRLATGLPPANPAVQTFAIPLHVVQDDLRSEDLPFGSRGGIAVRYNFPADGEYLFKVRLRTNWQDYIMGMGWPQQFDVRLDGERLRRFTVGGKAPGKPSPASFTGPGEPGSIDWEEYMMSADHQVEVRVRVQAGPHVVGVSFLRELWEPEGLPQPLQRGRLLANDELYMDYQAVQNLQIGGPYQITGSAKDTPSRRAIFVCQPKGSADELPCATKILTRLARRAYRRPATERDLSMLREFFQRGRREGGSFDNGIQFALEFLLTDPAFLLRVHAESAGAASGRAYRLGDLELASRLSFFLWSSIPDEPLLDLAARGKLSDPAMLDQQVKRMLADPRAVEALAGDFAAQWLNLRRVGEVVVDPEVYPNFDANLLESFQQETGLFVASNIREDRPLSELLNADYTFVNERLARHYGIPGVYGSRFRRVALPNHDERGGLLAQGGLLAATSYPDRTSPVLRGKWLLDNIFGLPIPPPPPGVDTNIDNKPGAATKSIRERLAQHRQNPTCANCHSVIDPLGFALENFDVIGGWRTVDERGIPVDTSGTMASGAQVNGFPGLRKLLLARPDQFPRTVAEKLLAYAIGRRLDYYDQPAVRKIVRQAAANDYRWSAIVLGIVKSAPFLMQAPHAESEGSVVQR